MATRQSHDLTAEMQQFPGCQEFNQSTSSIGRFADPTSPVSMRADGPRIEAKSGLNSILWIGAPTRL